MDNEEKKAKEAELIFKKRAVTSPKLQVNIPEVNQPKSLEEAEDESGLDSDLKATLKRLFPKFPIRILNQVAQAVMVGRVLHETMLDRIHLTVISVVEDWDEKEDGELSVQAVIDMTTTAYEIGLDSKGRVDAIELHSSQNEQDNLERLASNIA